MNLDSPYISVHAYYTPYFFFCMPITYISSHYQTIGSNDDNKDKDRPNYCLYVSIQRFKFTPKTFFFLPETLKLNYIHQLTNYSYTRMDFACVMKFCIYIDTSNQTRVLSMLIWPLLYFYLFFRVFIWCVSFAYFINVIPTIQIKLSNKLQSKGI